jgi:hypothetical protein
MIIRGFIKYMEEMGNWILPDLLSTQRRAPTTLAFDIPQFLWREKGTVSKPLFPVEKIRI